MAFSTTLVSSILAAIAAGVTIGLGQGLATIVVVYLATAVVSQLVLLISLALRQSDEGSAR